MFNSNKYQTIFCYVDELEKIFQSIDEIDEIVRILEEFMTKCHVLYVKQYNKDIQIYSVFISSKINQFPLSFEIVLSEQFCLLLSETFMNWCFTLRDLKKILSLKSSYSKKMYIKLKKKQSRKGNWIITKSELLRLLNAPESLEEQSNFNKRVLKPIYSDLKTCFSRFELIPNKGTTRGGPIRSYTFIWEDENENEEG